MPLARARWQQLQDGAQGEALARARLTNDTQHFAGVHRERYAVYRNVTTRDAGEAVEIRVPDNGIGSPADIRDKLFQPFSSTKPSGEGTGLGLSMTYDIVTQQHGGGTAADSKVGEYSEFTIRMRRNG
jgi:signal transduction histidine kinase